MVVYFINSTGKPIHKCWQAAKTKQRIKVEQMQILVVERAQQIQIQDQEITRKERELDATIRRPADAEKYKLEKLAEANK